MPNHSLEATANFLQGSPLDSCRLTAATRRMALFNLDLASRGKKKKQNRSQLHLFRTVPRSASINGTPSPLLCCHSWLQKTLQMWFLRGPDVHSDGLGLFFFLSLSFYVVKMLLGSLHCISDTLRLLIIYTEWEKCCLNFHLTKKMLWREK